MSTRFFISPDSALWAESVCNSGQESVMSNNNNLNRAVFIGDIIRAAINGEQLPENPPLSMEDHVRIHAASQGVYLPKDKSHE
jgi:hypothetical protein